MFHFRIVLFALLVSVASAQTTPKEIDRVYPDAYALYLDIHQNPELSSHETQTAAHHPEHIFLPLNERRHKLLADPRKHILILDLRKSRRLLACKALAYNSAGENNA